jgi:hypothetical protein
MSEVILLSVVAEIRFLRGEFLISLVVHSGSRDQLLTCSDQNGATELVLIQLLSGFLCVMEFPRLKCILTDPDEYISNNQLKSLSMELFELIPMEGIDISPRFRGYHGSRLTSCC